MYYILDTVNTTNVNGENIEVRVSKPKLQNATIEERVTLLELQVNYLIKVQYVHKNNVPNYINVFVRLLQTGSKDCCNELPTWTHRKGSAAIVTSRQSAGVALEVNLRIIWLRKI